MAIGDVFQDGSNKFGILTPTVTSNSKGFVVESFTRNKTTNRVDLNDGAGSPLGAVTVPQREEVSMTVQLGTTVTLPTIGDDVVYKANGETASTTYVVTEVSVNETQEDFVRVNISAYAKTNN